MRTFFVLAAVSASFASQAVVATTSHIAPGAADSTFSYVGSMTGASAVAIGAYTVLTAGHVAAGDLYLNGQRYRMASTEMGPMVNNKATDLRVVQLLDALPGWYQVATTIKSNSALTMVGYGGTGVVNDTSTGYEILNGGVRRAGTNVLSNKATVSGRGPSLRSLLDGAGEAALAGGDSGGGWFVGGKLVGVSSFTYTTNVKKADYGFAKKAYFGSGAIDLTNKTISGWITAQIAAPRSPGGNGMQAVPEPGSIMALALGLAPILRRRRKVASASGRPCL